MSAGPTGLLSRVTTSSPIRPQAPRVACSHNRAASGPGAASLPRSFRPIVLLSVMLGVWYVGAAAAQEPPDAPPLTVASVVIAGVDDLEPAVRLPRRLPIRRGVPYTADRLSAMETVLLTVLTNAGRPYARVEISAEVDAAAGTADVVFEVVAGPRVRFGPVTIRAPAPLREEDIRARITFEEGDLFGPTPIERTREALEAMPGVEAAGVQPLGLERGDTIIPTIVIVTRPDRLHGIGIRGTLSSIECLELAAFWSHEHFLGEPRVFSFGGGFANLLASLLDSRFPCVSTGDAPYSQVSYFVTADLHQPVIPYPPTDFRVRTFFRRESAPQAYLVHGFGAHLAVEREIRPGARIMLAYSPERNELRAAGHYFCINFGACSAPAIREFAGPRRLAPLEASFRWLPPAFREPLAGPGAREPGLWPGVIGPLWQPWARAGLAVAGGATGSQFGYVRAVGEGAVTRITGARTEIAVRSRVGVLGRAAEVLPPQVRFFSGGVNTVRGVPQNLLGPLVLVTSVAGAEAIGCEPEPGGCPPELRPRPDRVSVRPRGGTAVAEANLEGRIWLTRRFQLAGFLDGGLVRGDVGLGPDTRRRWEGMAAPGVGLRWVTAIGPLRLDVGYDARTGREVPILLEDREEERLVPLGQVIWDPYTHDDPGGWREFWRRLQVHLAVGQPF